MGRRLPSGPQGVAPACSSWTCRDTAQWSPPRGVGGASSGVAFLCRTETFFFSFSLLFSLWPISASQAGENKKHRRKQLREGTEAPALALGEQAFCQVRLFRSLPLGCKDSDHEPPSRPRRHPRWLGAGQACCLALLFLPTRPFKAGRPVRLEGLGPGQPGHPGGNRRDPREGRILGATGWERQDSSGAHPPASAAVTLHLRASQGPGQEEVQTEATLGSKALPAGRGWWPAAGKPLCSPELRCRSS